MGKLGLKLLRARPHCQYITNLETQVRPSVQVSAQLRPPEASFQSHCWSLTSEFKESATVPLPSNSCRPGKFHNFRKLEHSHHVTKVTQFQSSFPSRLQPHSWRSGIEVLETRKHRMLEQAEILAMT